MGPSIGSCALPFQHMGMTGYTLLAIRSSRMALLPYPFSAINTLGAGPNSDINGSYPLQSDASPLDRVTAIGRPMELVLGSVLASDRLAIAGYSPDEHPSCT